METEICFIITLILYSWRLDMKSKNFKNFLKSLDKRWVFREDNNQLGKTSLSISTIYFPDYLKIVNFC